MSRRNVSPRLARPTWPAMSVAAGAIVLLGSLVAPAGAEDDIVIRPETVIIDAPGTVHTVANVPVPADLVGKPCDLRVVTKNGQSVHRGNSVITSTGSTRAVVAGVEDDSNGSVLDTRRVELGPQILVELELGPDGSSSLGFTVGFECTPSSLLPPVLPAQQTAPPTTAAPTTAIPTTVAPTTTLPPTTLPPTTTLPATVPGPTVFPAKVEAPLLPAAPPAKATVGDPDFTG